MSEREETLKRSERERWNKVAPAWATWWHVLERGAQPLSDRMVELAAIEAGQRVLDIASGLGEPAATAARRVGPGGRVVATDQSSGMVAAGRERALTLGLPQLEFREMDADAPDLPEASFDAVLCRWGLMFLPDLDRALLGLRRLLVPGGRMCAAVWSTADEVPMIGMPARIARSLIDVPPPAPDAPAPPAPFALADVHALEAAFTRAGFVRARHETMKVTMTFESTEQFTAFVSEMSSSMAALLEDQPAAKRDLVWLGIREAAAAFADGTGTVRMPNTTFCVVAEQPS